MKKHFILLSCLGLLACTANPLEKQSQPSPQASASASASPSASPSASLPPVSSEDLALITEANLHFQALTVKTTPNSAQVELGKMLFYDPRLSINNKISCKSCHNLETFGVDNRATSLGHVSQTGTRNAPTVLNAVYNKTQFWDGRAKDLQAQAGQPILNPLEMAMPSENAVIQKLSKISGYRDSFQKAFPGQENALTYANLSLALARFEETLITPGRFDQFLQGDGKALSDAEKKGLKAFMNKGCVACHNGPGLGGESFQKFGVIGPYPHQADLGRYEVSKLEKDRYLFKVPLLRNIEHTQPYFHDGKIADLKEAVRIMAKTEFGDDYTEPQIEELVSFLKSLSGLVPAEAKTAPVLPQ